VRSFLGKFGAAFVVLLSIFIVEAWGQHWKLKKKEDGSIFLA